MSEKSKKGKTGIIFLFLVILLLLVFFTTGFFVVQPIGAIPEGITIWYFRSGTNFDFIDSADGFLLENSNGVSLLGRATVISEFQKMTQNKTILKLPYMEFMYKISTGGVEFEK